MEKGTIGQGNIAKIESLDLPSASSYSITFLLPTEMDELFRCQSPNTEYDTEYDTEYYSEYYSE